MSQCGLQSLRQFLSGSCNSQLHRSSAGTHCTVSTWLRKMVAEQGGEGLGRCRRWQWRLWGNLCWRSPEDDEQSSSRSGWVVETPHTFPRADDAHHGAKTFHSPCSLPTNLCPRTVDRNARRTLHPCLAQSEYVWSARTQRFCLRILLWQLLFLLLCCVSPSSIKLPRWNSLCQAVGKRRASRHLTHR